MPVREDNALALPLQLLGVLRRRPWLVLVPAALGFVVALVGLGIRLPTWSAEAVLSVKEPVRLPTDLTRKEPPSTAAELAHVTSAATVAEVVRDVPEGGNAAGGVRHLGLATRVDDLSYRPLHRLLGGVGVPEAPGRLYAHLHASAPESPRRLRVSFPEPGLVRLARPGGLLGEEDPVELPFAGGIVKYQGLALELEPWGDMSGRLFELSFVGESQAAFDVLARLSAGETRKGSRVIEVYYEDSDPHRAADVVNAVCETYLAQSRQRLRDQSTDRLARVDAEIQRTRAELARAFEELARLRNERPFSVDPEQSAKFLSLNLSELDLEIADVQLERAAVTEALAHLAQGDFGGLSQIARSTADETTATLIGQFATLRSQVFVLDRSDAGSYRRMLQERIAQLGELKSNLEQEIAGQESALAGLRDEGLVGLGMLGGFGRGATGVDAVTHVLIERATTLRAKLDELSEEYRPEHPEIRRLTASIAEHESKLERLLANRVEGLRRQLAHQESFLAETERLLDLHPETERREIEAALERMRPVLVGHLENLGESLRRREVSTMTEILQLRRELALLPESERIQLDSSVRVAHFQEQVSELLATKESLALERALGEPTLDLVDRATPAALPAAPRFRFGLVLGTCLGLFAGILLALAAETASDRVLRPEDAERTAGAEVLGIVGDLPETRERVPEAFRSLRANLTLGLPSDGRAALGLTSSERSRTRGSTALGLAQAFAAASKSVLLVIVSPPDDERHEPLFAPTDGQEDWAEVVRPSNVENVHLLGPGTASSSSLRDPFAHQRTLKVLAHMRERYDVVLFDLPSVAMSADAESLAPHLDGLLLAVPEQRARHGPLDEAARRLRRCGGNVLGLVWNQGRRPLEIVTPPLVLLRPSRAA